MYLYIHGITYHISTFRNVFVLTSCYNACFQVHVHVHVQCISFPSLPTPLSPFSFPQIQGSYDGSAVKGNRDVNIGTCTWENPLPLGVLLQWPPLATSYTTVGVVSYSTSSVECWPHIGMGHLKDNPELHNALVHVQCMCIHTYVCMYLYIYTYMCYSSLHFILCMWALIITCMLHSYMCLNKINRASVNVVSIYMYEVLLKWNA